MNESLSFMLISILIIGGITGGLIGFYSDLTSTYSSTLTEPINNQQVQMIRNLNYTHKVHDEITAPLEEKIAAVSEGGGALNIIDFVYSSVVDSVIWMVNVPVFMVTWIKTMAMPLSGWVPMWAINLVIGIITLVTIFIIIKTIMKWKF